MVWHAVYLLSATWARVREVLFGSKLRIRGEKDEHVNGISAAAAFKFAATENKILFSL